MEHLSVLKNDVQNFIDLRGDEIFVDATLGLGGHALDVVKRLTKGGRLIAFDQDERNLVEAKKRLKAYEKQITYIHDNFRYLKTRITGEGIGEVDYIFFDLGLSSPHVDESERGFSFMREGPLDMRFDQRNEKTAATVVNTYGQEDLANVIYEYGEERASRKIARQIIARREEKPFETTTELAEFLESIIHKKRSKKGANSHPATRIFQALRIEVNDEFGALKDAMKQATEILKVGGRILIITFHSLEDRLVKKFFMELEKPPVGVEKAMYQSHGDPIFKRITKKPVIPAQEELDENPRSRSAKLRVYEKLLQV